MQIIPAILVKTKKEFFRRLKIAAGFADCVQIDIMDGLFVENKTPRDLNNGKWHGEYLRNGGKAISIELHLMVVDPWDYIRDWQAYKEVKRVIWHVEAPLEHGELIEIVHAAKIEAGMAINPGSEIKYLLPYLAKKNNEDTLDEVLVMGVKPGYSGQDFIKESLKTIKRLRNKFPKLKIAVDGGVNLETAALIKKAGANRLNAAGAIFMAKEPGEVYRQLKKSNIKMSYELQVTSYKSKNI